MPCSEMVRRGRAFGEQGYYYEALECFEQGAEWDPYSPVSDIIKTKKPNL
jgi:hypothetical protein